MIHKKLLKQILPGFIPLIVFIIADEVWGTRIGLIVAIAFGILGLAYFWIKDKKFDKFILFDTLLIVVLGIVSILLDNEVFFKIKPALIGVLVCVILAISVYTPSNIMLNMSKRYLGGMEINEQQYTQIKRSMKMMFYLFVIYTALVFYSVWFMSKEAWAFISGALFYIMFGIYMAYEFIKTKIAQRKMKNEEWLPLVNKKGEVIGKAPRSICHTNKNNLHPVVHLHVINRKGELFLQKRPMHKQIQPGKWDTAVGGHIEFGESLEESLKREVFEEIGIKEFEPKLISKYIWESDVESEYIFCFLTEYNGSFNLSNHELDGGKFWSKKELDLNLNKSIFTPNFEIEYSKIVRKLLN